MPAQCLTLELSSINDFHKSKTTSMMEEPPIVFVIGATGAQGRPVVKHLLKDKTYAVRFLTRDAKSNRSVELIELGASPVEGTFANEGDLRKGFRGATYAFVNIDGFNTGEKTETFWAIRSYELAIEEGIKFFVYGNLDYAYKKSGYNPIFRTGHYDGKGRIGEWMLGQKNEKMGVALFTSGPYIDMSLSIHTPMAPKVEEGIVTWRVPLGEGAVAHVDLEDCGYYVRWLFDNQPNGMDLEVAIDLISYHDLTKAFEKVTGHPARYIDTDLEVYWRSGPMGRGENAAGYNADTTDAATMTLRHNFTGFWNIWKHSGGNRGLIQRDFALLDKIHPQRVKSAEEWLAKADRLGREQGIGGLWEQVNNPKPVLKLMEDGRKGRL